MDCGATGDGGELRGDACADGEGSGGGRKVFTGERISTRAGSAHVLGEEACRALVLLGARDREVQAALARATEGMMERLAKSRRREKEAGRTWRGEYCCAKCSCELWRHMLAGGLSDADPEAWLAAGVKDLCGHRTGGGRWRRFPFHYTLLALSEMAVPGTVREMRYAAPVCERMVRGRAGGGDRFEERRRLLAERVLARV